MTTCQKRQSAIIVRNKYSGREKKIITTAFDYIDDCNPNNKSLHVSIISLKGEVIEIGVNNEKAFFAGHPFGYLSIHSEYAVVRKFLNSHYAGQLHQYDLWNVRINRFNEVVNSRPCKRCQYMLGVFTPKRVFYSNEFGEFEQWLK